MKCDWHQLGEYIEPCDERNGETFGVESVRGISINKAIIPTKADMEGVSLKPYKLLKPEEFCFVTVTSRNGGKISLACNETDETYIVSSSYEVFRVTRKDELLPMYLNMLIRRPEFDRYARFNSWGSARETFSYNDMRRVRVPVPTIDEQRRVVDAWQGLRRMKEENERMAEPLLVLCRSYMQEVKKKYHYASLADYIVRCEEKNSSGKYGEEDLLGVNSQHEFCPTRATTQGVDMKQYQIVHGDQFVYNPARLDIGSIALFKGKDCIVSTLYEIFKIKPEAKNELLSDYLMLWYERGEFARYVGFTNWGSAREYFWLDSMMRVKIPLPPKEVQESVVAVYRVAMEAKRIAAEADELSRQICPALIQHVVRGGK